MYYTKKFVPKQDWNVMSSNALKILEKKKTIFDLNAFAYARSIAYIPIKLIK